MSDPTAPSLDHYVRPEDEGRHDPGPETWWNESWYLDLITADGSLAGYVRLGLHPNQGVAWWTAALVGKDRPCVMAVRYDLPLPKPDAMNLHAEDVAIDLRVVDPLSEFRVVASSPATIHASATDVYEGGAGEPTTLAFDLTWTTDGAPYHYALSPRYEIPCLVRGTITVGGESLTLVGQGQRDHSWANRDWWSFEWCWFSGRLDDGTRVHGADIRVAEGFRMAFGYSQHAGQTVPIHSDLLVEEDRGRHGMPTRAIISCPPAGLDLVATPLSGGPLLLLDGTGGRAHFHRASCRYQATDGRAGLGWIEWNQVHVKPGG
jgi:hypothetical protein